LLHVVGTERVAAGIDTERLVVERTPLRRQRIVDELVVHFTIAGTDCSAHLAGGQVDQPALEVGFPDVLLDLRAVFQIRANGLEAVLGKTPRRRDEEVQAAGAGCGRCTEAKVRGVAGSPEALAEVARLKNG